MRSLFITFFISLVGLNLAVRAQAIESSQSKFAVIISGIGGEEIYQRQFAAWAVSLRKTLIEHLSFAEDQTFLLSEKNQSRATAEEVRKIFANLKTATNPNSLVFIFLIGHGSFDGKEAKFNLVGPDLTAKDYAALIKTLPTSRVVFINMASASGEFIKPLSTEGIIVVTATRSGTEQNATHFPENFIVALSNPEADADKNGRISVLEAFDYTTKMTAGWFDQQGRLVTEHALIDDNGDGVGHQKAEAGDGALAKTTFFDSLPQRDDPTLTKLLAERARLENDIERLKARKDQMKAEIYEAALENLLIELATLNQRLKEKQE